MSTALRVPETWECTGDDPREVLAQTGGARFVRDAFIRFRASDGFSHARSLALVIALLFVQGTIALVGLAGVLAGNGVGGAIVRTLRTAAPGPAGRVLTDAALHAQHIGSSGHYFALALGLLGSLVAGATGAGQVERALNRMYGGEQDRPIVQKYSHALVLSVTAGGLGVLAFVGFAFDEPIGKSLGDQTATDVWNIARWPASFALTGGAVALLFRSAPRRRQPAWSWLVYGVAVSTLLWSAVTLLLRLFFEVSPAFGQTYGPLTGLMALLIWALLSSIVLLFGAAVAAQLEAVRAGRPGPRDPAKQKDTGATASSVSAAMHSEGVLLQESDARGRTSCSRTSGRWR